MATKKQDENKKKVTKKTSTTKKTTTAKKTAKKVEVVEEVKVNKEEKEDQLREKNNITSLIELIGIIIAVIVILVFFPHTVVFNITVLLLMLSILIFVHELGHFIAAKKFGVHVYEFAIGMGPLVFSFRRKNDPTLYSLRAFPIGGYNSIAGESYDDDDKIGKDKMLCYKPKWQRLIILFAGVFMNFVTAFILLFAVGFTGVSDQNNIVAKVENGSPAQQAGIVAGDKILKVNDHKIDTWSYLAVVNILKTDSNEYTYVIERKDGKQETVKITPKDAIQDKDGNIYYIDDTNTEEKIISDHNLKKSDYEKTKIIGVYGDSTVKYGLKTAFSYACKRFVTLFRTMILIVVSLFTGKVSINSLSGPVGMYTVVDSVAKVGFANLVYLTAYLSLNLAVMNLLPIPAVDGGHIVFVLIEYITGKRVNERVEAIFHFVGFILLMLLMLYVLYNDIFKLIN